MTARRYSAQVTTDTSIVTTTETILATITSVTTPRNNTRVQLVGKCDITTGTNTTALTFRWRRGATITDTVVGESNVDQVEAAAGSTEDHVHIVEDTPGDVNAQTYVFTVQQTAASANGSALFAVGWADVDF